MLKPIRAGGEGAKGEKAMEERVGMIRVSIWRGEGERGRWQRFEAPARGNQTVLDLVSWIQRNADSTLAYRFSCRVGMCGSCAMTVNGKPRWTCRTRVEAAMEKGRLAIAPLRNLPVIRDLAVDMEPFFAKWAAAGGRHRPSATRRDPMPQIRPDEPGRVEADKGIECINCAICHAACDTVAGDPGYLGPAPLLRAWTLFNDERQADRNAVLEAVSGRGGCHSCHSQGSCSLHCPNALEPMRAIAGLKRASARAFLKGGAAR